MLADCRLLSQPKGDHISTGRVLTRLDGRQGPFIRSLFGSFENQKPVIRRSVQLSIMPTINVGPDSRQELQLIADALGKSRKVVVVTGAGISTNCGIPVSKSQATSMLTLLTV